MVDPHPPRPQVELYLDTWETFGTQEFSLERFRETVGTPADDAGSGSGSGDAEPALQPLVAAGLLERTGEGRYEIHLTPEDELDEWIDHTVSRVSSLYETVQSARRERDEAVAGAARADAIEFEGEAYLRTPVTPETTVSDVARALGDTFEANPDHDRAVLTAPADEAAHVQHLADRLCGDAADRLGSHSLQKVTTAVRGPDPESLTFRLYLTRTDTEPS